MFLRFRFFSVGLVFFLMFLVTDFTGCSSAQNSKSIPPGKTEKVFVVDSTPKALAEITRAQEKYKIELEKSFIIFANDEMLNVSTETVKLVGVVDSYTFYLKPEANVAFGEQTLAIIKGSTRLEFRKVKDCYKVKIPGAILAIRGTTLEVKVNPDNSSEVSLLEGKIEITRDSKTDSLKEGEKALLGPEGASIKIVPISPSDTPDFINNNSPEQLKKSIQKF
ncbi:MAG: FecR domain-containing protein [Candidatus Riflebacteria bacterium]|nr:FecR domain-containing protein [Candidatus Riflebacteria bacterium]